MTERLALLLVFVTSLSGTSQGALKPGCKIETLRACGDDFIPYSKHPHLHDFGKEFSDGCAKDKVQLPCTVNFINECVDGLPRAVALVAVKALEENIEATCIVGSETHKNYEKAIGCMNSVGDKVHKCISGYQGTLERAVVKAPKKEVVPYACCHYDDMADCLSTALAPCEEVGGKKIIFDVLEEAFGETLTLVCGSYTKGSESCKQLPALPRLSAKDRRIPNFVELLIELARIIGKKD